MEKDKCLVVIPTYNEAENLPLLVERLRAHFPCLIVDDNSPDGTGEVADALHEKYGSFVRVLHREKKEGLGKAYLDGFAYALRTSNRPYIGQMDADLSHPPEKMADLYWAVTQEDVDLAVGSRYIPGGGLDTDWAVWRKVLSRFANNYATTVLGSSLSDMTGAFRIWDRYLLEKVLSLPITSEGYCFLIETLIIAERIFQARIAEIPFYFKERSNGESKLSLPIQIEAARRVWQMRGIKHAF